MMTVTRLACPLCDWTLDVAPPEVNAAAARRVGLAMGIADGVHFLTSQAMRAQAEQVERDLRAHLSGHQLEEWIKALMQARAGTPPGPIGDLEVKSHYDADGNVERVEVLRADDVILVSGILLREHVERVKVHGDQFTVAGEHTYRIVGVSTVRVDTYIAERVTSSATVLGRVAERQRTEGLDVSGPRTDDR